METWNQHFTFAANFTDVLAFIDAHGMRSCEVEFQGYLFACRISDEIDFSALACLAMEVRAWWKTHDCSPVQPARALSQVQPCARTQLRLVQNRIDECTGYFRVDQVDPTAVFGAAEIEPARSKAAIDAFLARHWATFLSLWLKHGNQPRGLPAATRLPSGRPRDANDDWAYEQVALRGRPRPEVYREWLVRIGERATQLADPQQSFNHAIAARIRKPQESQYSTFAA